MPDQGAARYALSADELCLQRPIKIGNLGKVEDLKMIETDSGGVEKIARQVGPKKQFKSINCDQVN